MGRIAPLEAETPLTLSEAAVTALLANVAED